MISLGRRFSLEKKINSWTICLHNRLKSGELVKQSASLGSQPLSQSLRNTTYCKWWKPKINVKTLTYILTERLQSSEKLSFSRMLFLLPITLRIHLISSEIFHKNFLFPFLSITSLFFCCLSHHSKWIIFLQIILIRFCLQCTQHLKDFFNGVINYIMSTTLFPEIMLRSWHQGTLGAFLNNIVILSTPVSIYCIWALGLLLYHLII